MLVNRMTAQSLASKTHVQIAFLIHFLFLLNGIKWHLSGILVNREFRERNKLIEQETFKNKHQSIAFLLEHKRT